MLRPGANPALTKGQALFVIERMIAERRISPAESSKYAAEMEGEIRSIEKRLAELRAASGAQAQPAPAARPRNADRPRGNGSVKLRRRRAAKPLTAERRASQRLQGRYLGLIAQVPKRKRAKFSAMAKDKGREAAIAAMRTALRK